MNVMNTEFQKRLQALKKVHEELVQRRNQKEKLGNGVYERYQNPVLTAAHTPLFWRYDLNAKTNPYLMERFGINATFNSGAIKLNEKYYLVARVEGADRKSFFAIAESENGIDGFQFWDYPVELSAAKIPDTNVY